MKKIRWISLGMATVLSMTALSACGSSAATETTATTKAEATEVGTTAEQSDETPIIVGSKDFTESIIVGEIYALALEDAGYSVERQLQLGSFVVHDAIMDHEIDLYPEYTGTGLIDRLKMDPIYDPEECYETVKSEYEKQYQLTWLDHSNVNDSEGLAMLKTKADELGITSFSDAWEHAAELVMAGNGEFFEADSTYGRLAEVYGEHSWKKELTMDHNLTFKACESGEADIFNVYTTEGQLAGGKFLVLTDDKQAWPPYYLAPVIREDTLAAHPGMDEVINKVTATFTDDNIIALNAQVDIDGEEYEDVAAAYNETIKDSLK